jgi:hypothetical protein
MDDRSAMLLMNRQTMPLNLMWERIVISLFNKPGLSLLTASNPRPMTT